MLYNHRLPIILALALLAAAAIAWACPSSARCPIDSLSARFTGQTQVEDGVLMGVYSCPRGHEFVVRCN